ncbi:EF-hand domain-containing protein [Acaryochloris sp. IP29b_bin.148]|uniref:EF-hand domain-containing protein n=1 Tax=Acaryochloris sp. IP29b_bin.148 TaxID=2969218 RepID=UPI002617B2CB|nr:EF-hand domain-containing protein [Acaryochloris sp. IP29b_bin.148]
MSDFKSLEEQFLAFAGEDKKLNFEDFQEALKLNNKYLSERLFHIFDVDQTQGVNFQEFQQGIHRAKVEKLDFAFQLHDGNDDGFIDRQELAKFIQASLKQANLELTAEKRQQLLDILFKKADTDQNGEISLNEFKKLLSQSPQLQDVLSVNPEQWLKAPSSNGSTENIFQEQGERRWHYIKNNWGKFLFLFLYLAITFFLFFHAYTSPAYRFDTPWYRIARGCGLALNFNGALVLVPIMRHWMTVLRNTKLNKYLPIDEHIAFHKIVGHMIFVLAVIHTVAHIVNHIFESQAFKINYPLHFFLLYGPGYTGSLLMLLLLLMWYTSLPFIREKKKFNLFFNMHLAYVPLISLLFVHGPHFYRWAAVPIAAFLVERLVRFQRRKQKTHVIDAQILPNDVLSLAIARPHNFSFRASDYLYLKCPNISTNEWHPFTISSPPEQGNALSLHIRAVGSWTGTLFSEFRDLIQKRDKDVSVPQIPVYLDGPYHSPSSNIEQSEYAILIAGGIGVTPYASLLQSILHQRQTKSEQLKLKKIHFYWFNRTQDSFEWLLEIFQRLEAEDTFNLLDINLYQTGAPKDRDAPRFITLYTAIDLLHQEQKVDIITGLKKQFQYGRPVWDDIFKELQNHYQKEEYKDKNVDVFYCGPRGLSGTLRRKCYQYGFSYSKENF